MTKFVALGAVLGFLFAYFVLSHSGESAAVIVPAPPAPPQRPNMEQVLKLQPLPEGMMKRGRLAILDGGPS